MLFWCCATSLLYAPSKESRGGATTMQVWGWFTTSVTGELLPPPRRSRGLHAAARSAAHASSAPPARRHPAGGEHRAPRGASGQHPAADVVPARQRCCRHPVTRPAPPPGGAGLGTLVVTAVRPFHGRFGYAD